MKFNLKNTYIFEEDIETKFHNLITKNIKKFNNKDCYKVVIHFEYEFIENLDVDALRNGILKDSKNEINENKQYMYEAINIQLEKLINILDENKIKSYNNTIQSNKLKDKNSIIIEITEDKAQPTYVERGKSKMRIIYNLIIPSFSYKACLLNKMVIYKGYKLYCKFMGYINFDNKLMSEILGISETEDENQLLMYFIQKHPHLILPSNGDEDINKEKDKLYRYCLKVTKKYLKEEIYDKKLIKA